MHDPRTIANMILDEGGRRGRPITNLSLQKLLYFAHGLYLVGRGTPLVKGYFEAWDYGPVHPVVYKAFKDAGAHPITDRAKGQNPLTGQPVELKAIDDTAIKDHIERIVFFYGQFSAGNLVDLSHAKDAPWHFVVENAKNKIVLGLRISDNVILERFRYHKITVTEFSKFGDAIVEAPLLASD